MKRPALLVLGLIVFAGLGALASAQAEVRVHVAPDGQDSASGMRQISSGAGNDGPVRTLGRAQQLARQLLSAMRAGQRTPEQVRVVLAPGTYRLAAPLAFGKEDSGFSDAPVIYAAESPGKAVISGGIPLSVKRVDDRQVVFAAPGGMATAIQGGGQLYVRGKLATLARAPNRGEYWFVQRAVVLPGEGDDAGKHAFVPDPLSRDFLANIPSAERGRAILNVMHSWSAGLHRFGGGPQADRVGVTPKSLWPFLKFGASQRYFIENVSAAFDSPGEWLWQGDEIRYLLERGEKSDGIEATLPMLDRLLEIRGGAAQNGAVEHLQFQGIAFQHARALVPQDGFFDMQAAAKIGAAVEVNFARHIIFSDCRFSLIGGYGLWLRDGVRQSFVTGNDFSALGAGGVKVGLESQAPDDGNATGTNQIVANRISDTGNRYVGAVGIWVGQSFDNDVSYNTIWNTTYSGISVGWKWGYGASRAGRNRISGNLLYNIGQGFLDDLGAIYTLGESPGTEISRNLIREVRAYRGYGPGGWGIYLDEGSSQIVVKNNVVIGTDSGAVHLHFGRENVISDNLFAWGVPGELMVRRSDPGKTRLRFINNVLAPANTNIFSGHLTNADVIFSDNVILLSPDKPVPSAAQCKQDCTVTKGTVRVESSPRAITVTGIDVERRVVLESVVRNAGALPEGRSTKYVASVLLQAAQTLPAVSATPRERRVLAGAKTISVDPGQLPAGVRPPEFNYEPKGIPTAIRNVRDSSAPGGACLLMEDGAQFTNKYDPHMHMKLDYSDGEMTVSFSVKIDAYADLIHEWRDDAVPFLTGPALRISRAGLEVGGRVLSPAEPGDWLQISIQTRLGNRGGKWQLKVVDAKRRTQTFSDLPFKSPDWQHLKWLGFISNAVQSSTICTSSIRIQPSP